ncbi:hypothetical protein SAMN05216345_10721 [Cupriavidus sp. YR651]|uniref:hypothetical protein n=1 Tax=Cupriavidus sp. YR651 TaxID=1855315 RepID=UPI00088289C9|nr:hypothetical protein [Cupriavidus sp. YR651]SDD22359.1 hypothetical protein SAMN05216345_10721 [Cupriavidus sp. YR651]
MIKSFADFHGIDPNAFAATGALDPIPGIDTKLFIDPSLLREAATPEIGGSFKVVEEYFADVLKIVENIGKVGDPFWRKADQLLTFPEVDGLCIGYSKGTRGSGMGKDTRAKLLDTIIQISRAGTKDPRIFELIGAFEEGIGPDRISDMIAKIVLPDLITFTQRVCSDLGIPMTAHRVANGLQQEDLPSNPITERPLILVPKEILRNLPVAESFADIGWIASQNQDLRDRFNAIIGGRWSDLTLARQKEILKSSFIERPDILKMVIDAYCSADRQAYDFDNDPAGEVIWYRTSKTVAQEVPLQLALSDNPTQSEVETVVQKICEHFRTLLEDNQLCKLLYDGEGKKKHESAAQLLFFGVASAYCEANNLDLSPESDAGRGPVDFKASRGYREKVVVEIKLTTNQNLVSGFLNQLPIYQKAENAPKGVYLVVHNGGSEARLDALLKESASAGNAAPRVIVVDGIPKVSASKAKSRD